MGDVVKFPVKGTKIKMWFDKAAGLALEINEPASQAWVRNHVPAQFHKLMYGNIRTLVKQGDNK